MNSKLKTLILASTFTACFSVSGCGSLIKVHRLDVQQGNVITQDMLGKLRKGMSKSDVLAVLGQPVLSSILKKDSLDYVYTWQPGYGKFTKKQVIVTFRKGRMTHYTQS
jgi:outer membrane protein assembly factor BamE